jgi:hypothetical protein
MIKALNTIFLIFLISFPCYSQTVDHSSKQTNRPTGRDSAHQDVDTVRTYIHHISDLNFRDQEYKIELWLYLTSKDSLQESLANQIEVKDAKETKITFIPEWHDGKKIVEDSYFRRLLKVKCTMIQKWDVDGFPFDTNRLDIIIYTIRPRERLLLHPFTKKPNYSDDKHSTWDIENGWQCSKDSVKINEIVFSDIFDNKQYSALYYTIPIVRQGHWGLFFKLFVGMYVAFLVAFIAMFISVDEVEPRFGLPVGGLFAAIANKYIIEGLLPLSTEFNLIDKLHSTAIIFILIIIAYSAVLLFLSKDKKSPELIRDTLMKNLPFRFYIFYRKKISMDIERFNKRMIVLLSLSYILINILFIKWGWD